MWLASGCRLGMDARGWMKSEKKYQRSRTDESSVSGGDSRRGGDRKIGKKNRNNHSMELRDFLAIFLAIHRQDIYRELKLSSARRHGGSLKQRRDVEENWSV